MRLITSTCKIYAARLFADMQNLLFFLLAICIWLGIFMLCYPRLISFGFSEISGHLGFALIFYVVISPRLCNHGSMPLPYLNLYAGERRD